MSIFVPTNYKHRQVMNSKDKEMAARIAAMYLEKKPRPELFLVNLCSTEDDSQGGYYRKFSEEDKAVIRKWETENEDDLSLDEFLEYEDKDLYERLVSNSSPYPLNMIDSCDLNDMKKYSPCQIREYHKDKDQYSVYGASFPLSDEEFCLLLADRIDSVMGMSMNSIVISHPELAQEIMSHLVDVTWGIHYANPYPFLVILSEIENAANEILDPHTDILGLFTSDDDTLRKYVIRQQIVPSYVTLYEDLNEPEEGQYHVNACFYGKSLHVLQEGIREFGYYDRDKADFDAEALCEKTGAKNYQELMDIIKEKFKARTALSDIRGWVAGLGL